MNSAHVSWVLYRTTQLREELKVANEIKDWNFKQPAIIKIWKDFQSDIVNYIGECEAK